MGDKCKGQRLCMSRDAYEAMHEQVEAKDREIAELRARAAEQQEAVDQAVAMAEYLEGHSKGAMAERVKTALSAKFAQERIAYVTKLKELASCAYQAMGAHDAPVNWLDALSNAAVGRPFETESLLPYAPQAVCDAVKERDEARECVGRLCKFIGFLRDLYPDPIHSSCAPAIAATPEHLR